MASTSSVHAAAAPPVRGETTLETLVVLGARDPAGPAPERTLDDASIAAYGLDTVADVLKRVSTEQGDTAEALVILVNGERVSDASSVLAYPAEAIARLQVLPRGSTAAAGVGSTARVYNIVLRPSFRSTVASVAYRLATGAGANSPSGGLNYTRIQQPNRLNASLKIRRDSALLESQREVRQPVPAAPYAIGGNVVPDPRTAFTDIDPMLSVLAGRSVGVVAIPFALGRPELARFTSGAVSSTDAGAYRTLRPEALGLEANLSANQRLAERLTASISAHANWNRMESRIGLPQGVLILPQSNPYSPFSRDVGLAIYGRTPSKQRSRTAAGALDGAITAILSPEWRGTLGGRLGVEDQRTRTTRQISGSSFPVFHAPDVNPFSADLSTQLLLQREVARSRSTYHGVRSAVWGPVKTLPAGKLQGSLAFEVTREQNRSEANIGGRDTDRYARADRRVQVTAEVPLATRHSRSWAWLGDTSATLEYAVADVTDLSLLHRTNAALTWSPLRWLTIQASRASDEKASPLALLNSPVITTPGVRYFDVLTGETVEITGIFGGVANLGPESSTTKRLGVSMRPFPAANLQLRSDYTSTVSRGAASALPPPGPEVVAAFPGRFLRDAGGGLIQVDFRPVALQRQDLEQLTVGFTLDAPLGQKAPTREAGRRLQAAASHTWYITDRVVLRRGGPSVDLLDGGALGYGGGRPRRQLSANLGVTDRGIGLQLSGSWRDSTVLRTGPSGEGALRFAPLRLVNLRTYIDVARVFPATSWSKGLKATLSVNNLTGARQRVQDEVGLTPQRFQPAYLDPVGRTIDLELRKTF